MKIFLYLVFGLVTLVFFLYLRFPSELVKIAIDDRVKQVDPDAHVDVDVISPTIPPGLKLEPLSVHYAGLPVLRMDFLKISPNLFDLFSSSGSYTYSGDIGSGNLKGRAVADIVNDRSQSKVTMTLNRVPLTSFEILNQWTGYKADGDLDANIAFDSTKGGGTADVDLAISPARIAFAPPLMGIASLDFSELKSQLVVTRRMLQIKHCDVIGDQIDGKITGTIVFREPVETSRLSLSLTIRPQQGFLADHKSDMIGGLLSSANAQKRGIVFRITGTINNPRYVIR